LVARLSSASPLIPPPAGAIHRHATLNVGTSRLPVTEASYNASLVPFFDDRRRSRVSVPIVLCLVLVEDVVMTRW
jgi:hypothetical protein